MASNQNLKNDEGRVQLIRLRDCTLEPQTSLLGVGQKTALPPQAHQHQGPAKAGGGRCLAKCLQACDMLHINGPRQPVAGALGLNTTCVSDQISGYKRPEPVMRQPVNCATASSCPICLHPGSPLPSPHRSIPMKLESPRGEGGKTTEKVKNA